MFELFQRSILDLIFHKNWLLKEVYLDECYQPALGKIQDNLKNTQILDIMLVVHM
jgi:hypothetical protein